MVEARRNLAQVSSVQSLGGLIKILPGVNRLGSDLLNLGLNGGDGWRGSLGGR